MVPWYRRGRRNIWLSIVLYSNSERLQTDRQTDRRRATASDTLAASLVAAATATAAM